MMGLAAGGLASAMLGLAPATAEATGGIGFVGSAQAQTAPATTTPWWPSKYGKDDQIGATNLITPDKILEALKRVKDGKVYEMSHLCESSMPKFGERVFAIRIRGAPTGGPLGANNVIWNDEFVATEIGQVGTQMDGLGHIGMAFKGDGKTEMRFHRRCDADSCARLRLETGHHGRRDWLARMSRIGKPLMGATFVGMGFFVLSGLDKIVEASMTRAMPDWLVTVTTRL
jgi:hypothetical protein